MQLEWNKGFFVENGDGLTPLSGEGRQLQHKEIKSNKKYDSRSEWKSPNIRSVYDLWQDK